ncbi:molybdopterin biosynthesis protein MoeB [Gluconobacter kanchanaburiensis NBRC 103587]|nr:molybdopterin biosynthesis protein MoeB [Gluconobacter kanchanaburiensis NBRC 103587]
MDLSNLQRQVLYDMKDIGQFKVEAAASRLKAMNPLVKIRTYAFEATDAILDDLVSGYDVICDGTDNFGTRFAVSDACVRQGRTLVAGAVQGFSGQLAVFRPQLGGPCYRCLFPTAEETQAATCAQAGVLGAAAGVMGNLMAVEVMREIIGFEGRDKTQVTIWDALSGTSQRFVLYRDPACRVHADGDLSS